MRSICPRIYELNPGVLLNVPNVAPGDSRCTATDPAVNCTANLLRAARSI